jgi:hypothetical protein
MHPGKLLDWRKALIHLHRWSGIVMTAVFVVWFVSGIIFVYVGMPSCAVTSRPRKYASRGRRGQSRPALSDNEWWALANTTA